MNQKTTTMDLAFFDPNYMMPQLPVLPLEWKVLEWSGKFFLLLARKHTSATAVVP